MKFFPNPKTVLAIGGLTIQWYAVLILIGGVCAFQFIKKDLKERGYNPEVAEDIFIGCCSCGIIGARLWFCLFWDAHYYFSDLRHLLDFRGGGLAIQGCLIGGTLFVLTYCKLKKYSFIRLMDSIIPNLLLAQGIGRWGNFVNQEAFGRIVDESAMRFYPAFIKNNMFIDGAYRQPTFLWESLMNILGFIVIKFVYKKYGEPKRGDFLWLYLIWYGCTRFVVEGFRTDNLMFMGFKMSQMTALAFVIIGLVGFIVSRRIKPKKPVILFDLDGTLLNTQPAIMEAYRHIFRTYGKEEDFTPEVQMEVLGPSLHSMMVKYFPNEDPQKLIDEYRVINRKVHPDVVTPMNNCKELLVYLHENGYHMGVVSTKKKDLCQYGMSLFDLDKYMEIYIGPDEVEKGKPDPEGILKACELLKVSKDDLVYVGDSPTDIKAGIAAGAYTIGYIFEEKRKQQLIDANPNKVIDDLIEIKELLKEDHSWTHNLM